MRKSLRYLRIFWTVLCGLACVLLLVLWVRSYYSFSYASIDVDDPKIHFTSQTRTFLNKLGTIRVWSHPVFMWPHTYGWRFGTFTEPTNQPMIGSGFEWQSSPREYALQVPHWFQVVLFTIAAALPWICRLRWRFTVRTLLIATTLVAVVLGLTVWAVR